MFRTGPLSSVSELHCYDCVESRDLQIMKIHGQILSYAMGVLTMCSVYQIMTYMMTRIYETDACFGIKIAQTYFLNLRFLVFLFIF